MSPLHDSPENDLDYQVDFKRSKSSPSTASRSRSPRYASKGKSPQSFNGIHRRRKKRWSW